MMNLWIGPGNDSVFVGSIRFKNKWLKFYIVIIALTLVTIPCAICYLLTIFIKSSIFAVSTGSFAGIGIHSMNSEVVVESQSASMRSHYTGIGAIAGVKERRLYYAIKRCVISLSAIRIRVDFNAHAHAFCY